MNAETALSDALFGRLALFLLDKTGIALKDYKKYLVISRLGQLVGAGKKFVTFDRFYEALLTETDGVLTQAFINALTTNYSFLFRDAIHFRVMAQYLRDRGPDESYLRFWSAASSTGEEAYSMAITLANSSSLLPADRRILATDISTKVLARAQEGIYAAEEVLRHVDPRDQREYFEELEGNKFRVKDKLRTNVDFRQLNLQDAYPFRKKMDIIFLRNVMIYFGPQEKAQVIAKMHAHLKPGGLLFIGLSESLAGVHQGFVSYKHSVFRRLGN